MELEPEFVELDWSTRVDALNRGEVDCLWSGLTVSSDLLDTLDITQTYLASRPVLVVLWDTVEQYQTAEQPEWENGGSGSRLGRAERQLGPPASCDGDPCEQPAGALEALLQGSAQGAVVDLWVAQAAVETNRELTVQTRVELGTEELAAVLPHGATSPHSWTGRWQRSNRTGHWMRWLPNTG